MRNLTVLLLTFVLACTMAVAQNNGGTSSQTSQQKAQTPMTAPHTTRGDRSASQVDRGVAGDQNSANSNSANTNAANTNDQSAAPTTAAPQTPGATPAATQRSANTGGSGVPWGWIIIGIIVIAIILALIGRGSGDRAVVTREREIERDRTVGPTPADTRRDDDDIRRAG